MARLQPPLVKIWALALLSLPHALPPLCSVYLCPGFSLSRPLSLTFLLHSTSLPYLRCCVVVVVVALSHIDVRSSSRWWSPFAFQDVKLSPNDLKYPFFLLLHCFFAPTKYQTLKGLSLDRQSAATSTRCLGRVRRRTSSSLRSSLSLPSPSLPPLSPLSPLCSFYLLLWLLQSSFHSHSPYTNSRRRQPWTMTYDDEDDDDVIDDGGGGELSGT